MKQQNNIHMSVEELHSQWQSALDQLQETGADALIVRTAVHVGADGTYTKNNCEYDFTYSDRYGWLSQCDHIASNGRVSKYICTKTWTSGPCHEYS